MKKTCLPLLLALAPFAVTATGWTSETSDPTLAPIYCTGTDETGSTHVPPNATSPKPMTCNALNVKITEKEGWKLVVHILQSGSRSQGYHGELYKEGKRVVGKKGETVETPLGAFTWHGSMKERAHLWDSSGWVEK